MKPRKPSNLEVVDFGIAAVSFACLLAIYSLSPRSPQSVEAARKLAGFIPVVVSATLGARFLRKHPASAIRNVMIEFVEIVGVLAAIGCFYGIDLMLQDIDRGAASRFFSVSLWCYVAMIVFAKVLAAIAYFSGKANDQKG